MEYANSVLEVYMRSNSKFILGSTHVIEYAKKVWCSHQTFLLKPIRGFEPLTYALRVRRSTD